MGSSQPGPCRGRLSLSFSLEEFKSPVCCAMFSETLAKRMTKDLKWCEDIYDDGSDGMRSRQMKALTALTDAIYYALHSRGPSPVKLAREITEAIKKRPSFLAPRYLHGKNPSENIKSANDLLYGLSAVYARSVPGEMVDSTLKTSFLYMSLVPCMIKDDEKILKEMAGIFRYRFEAMEMADRYIDFLKLPQPNGQTCRQYDIQDFNLNPPKIIPTAQQLERLHRIQDDPDFFPMPSMANGVKLRFQKPGEYIEAAFYFSGISLDDYCQRVEQLSKAFYEELDRSIQWLWTLPDVGSKVQEVFSLFEKRAY